MGIKEVTTLRKSTCCLEPLEFDGLWKRIIYQKYMALRMGCDNNFFLPEDLVQHLRRQGLNKLNQIADEGWTNIWHQRWFSAIDIGLEGDVVGYFSNFISSLIYDHVQLRSESDELIWNRNKDGGRYTSKLGYEVAHWWLLKIWKLQAPRKTKILMWLALMDRISTWDYLQNKNKQGPCICYLCINVDEYVSHIFTRGPYSLQI